MMILDGSASPFLGWIQSGLTVIASTPVYAPFIPFSVFAILHATRIAFAYRNGTKALGIDDRIGLIQAAAFPVILIFSGGTVSSLLLGTVPGWLKDPLALANYAIVPLVVAKSPILPFLRSLPRVPLEIFFCMLDGFTRTMGATSLGLDAVLSHSDQGVRTSPWAMIVIATITGGGGGMIVPMFNIIQPNWAFVTPPFVRDGPNIDIWGATFVGYVYATLIDADPFFRLLPTLLFRYVPMLDLFISLPKNYAVQVRSSPLLPTSEAKIVCSLLLGVMLSYRYINALPASKVRTNKALGKKASDSGVKNKSQ